MLSDLLRFSRNQVVHYGIILDAFKHARNIKQISLEYFATWLSISSSIKELWSHPLVACFKINFDTSIRDPFFVQAAVYRNSKGNIIKALSQVRPPYDPTFGEEQAALLVVSLLLYCNIFFTVSYYGFRLAY
jgi:hypothetical protein